MFTCFPDKRGNVAIPNFADTNPSTLTSSSLSKAMEDFTIAAANA